MGVQTCALPIRSEEHTSELQSRENLVCRLLLEKKILSAFSGRLDERAIAAAKDVVVLLEFAEGLGDPQFATVAQVTRHREFTAHAFGDRRGDEVLGVPGLAPLVIDVRV